MSFWQQLPFDTTDYHWSSHLRYFTLRLSIIPTVDWDLLKKIQLEGRIEWINKFMGVGSMRSVPVHQELNASMYN